jgi:5-amino-6-(5-phospho-D-ribitylamino)uracil phosphatase
MPQGYLSREALRKVGQQVRMVAIDLDGTLLNDSKQVSDQVAAALSCLAPRGIRVIIATARPPRSVRHIYQALKLDTPQVNYNGALIWDEPRKKAIFHQPIDGADVMKIISAARLAYSDVLVTCEILDRWCTDRFDPTFVTETGKLFKPDVIGPLEGFCTQPITKLLLQGPRPVIDHLEKQLHEQWGDRAAITRTDPDLLQLMHRKVGKGMAVARVANYYGHSMQEVMAIGDAPNDVGMLRLAGASAAMGNAHPLAIEAAQWIAPSNNDHGVHAALEHFGLCD